MISYLKQHKFILALYSIWFVLAFVCLIVFGNIGFTLFVNQYVCVWADNVFRGLTYLGDGYFAIGIGILYWLLKGRKMGLLILINYALSSGITQLLKRLVFADHHRPLKLIPNASIHFPEGIELQYHHSFPSGHSTSAFALATMIALMSKQPKITVLLLSMACLVALSRVYLLQHFLGDTLAGSLIGFSSALLIYYFGYYRNQTRI